MFAWRFPRDQCSDASPSDRADAARSRGGLGPYRTRSRQGKIGHGTALRRFGFRPPRGEVRPRRPIRNRHGRLRRGIAEPRQPRHPAVIAAAWAVAGVASRPRQ